MIFPGTAISTTIPYVGDAYGGDQVLVSNLASAQAVSKVIDGGNGFEADKTYRVDGSIKGYIDSDISAGEAEIWFNFKNTAGTLVTETLAWSRDDLQTASWTAIAAADQIEVTAPSWATRLRVIIKTDAVNGWIAFDNISVSEENSGVWTSLNWGHGEFEDSTKWTLSTNDEFPASSAWFGDSGPVAAEDDRYSLVMTNMGYSQSTSPLFSAGTDTLDHFANAWIRGTIGSPGSGGIYLVTHYYDTNEDWLGQESVWDTVAARMYQQKTWKQISGEMDLPSGTVYIRLQLINAFGMVDVEFDDIGAEYVDTGVTTTLTVTDPGFETGGSWIDWDNETGNADRTNQTDPHGGSYVVYLGNNHLASGYAESASTTITGGEMYRFRIFAKQDVAANGNGVSFRLAFYDSGGGLSQRVTSSRWMNPGATAWSLASGFVLYEGIATAPDDAVSVKLEVSADQLDGYAFFDDVTFHEFDPGDTIYRSTYGLAGQPIATRVETSPSAGPNDGLFFIHTDHLGSVSAMTDDGGSLEGSIIRFDPFGEYRPGSGAGDITDRGFTGHKHNDYIKLIYMGARWYLPGLGRFASADSIVPDSANPQSYNRYSYVLNSPLNFIDPTGHCATYPDGTRDEECWQFLENGFCGDGLLCENYHEWIIVSLQSVWEKEELELVRAALLQTKNALESIGLDLSLISVSKFSRFNGEFIDGIGG